MNIKTLGREDFVLRQPVKSYNLPHLAMEIEPDESLTKHEDLGIEKYMDGYFLLLTGPGIKVIAKVFKPGGDRFILKNFEVYYLVRPQKRGWWKGLLNFIFKQEADEISTPQILADIESVIKEALPTLPRY